MERTLSPLPTQRVSRVEKSILGLGVGSLWLFQGACWLEFGCTGAGRVSREVECCVVLGP